MPGKTQSRRISLLLVLVFAFFCAATVIAAQSDPWLRPAAAPAPADNLPTAARVELGRQLFFDPRLSRKGSMSCASCHNPALGWSDGLPTAVGFDMQILGRATPTILNTAFNTIQMWDGRKADLEDQALGPIAAGGEMNLPLPEMVTRLKSIPGYAPHFEKAYPGMGISEVTVARAIASFERTVLSTESPFDRWRMGDENAVSPQVKRGFEVFTGKAKCAICHMGYNFTDNGFHNIGLKGDAANYDVGRYAQRPLKSMRGAFKTPTLRDIALTAPYMRNGAYTTLMEVVEHYNRGGDDQENLSMNIVPLSLTAAEKAELVAFMESLTGAPREISVPVLPR
ncbi:MAG TPA: cytochrome c peroxidase [Steroidobacteraceae bacterium]|nr:cytochrome c peroxidase [Steroidobacteraceae bacterium]